VVNKELQQIKKGISQSVANETGAFIIETRIEPGRYFVA